MAIEVKYIPNSKYVQFKKSRKSKWRNLTYERAVLLSEKQAKEIIEEFHVDNIYHNDNDHSKDMLITREITTVINVEGYTPKELLVFLVVVGGEGLYWMHKDNKVTLAFKDKAMKDRDQAELVYKLNMSGHTPKIVNH